MPRKKSKDDTKKIDKKEQLTTKKEETKERKPSRQEWRDGRWWRI